MHPRINALKNIITKLENEIGTMEATESDLVVELEALRASMQKHRSRINQLRSDCAPIASVPNEILLAIFEAGPSTFEEREGYAVCISQVSQLWRDIALATPSLWSWIRVDCQYIGDGQLRMLDLFIERSGKHPLEIAISLVRDEDDIYWVDFHDQTHKIFPLISRWHSLLLSGNIRGDVSSALSALDHVNAPMLEVFEVKIESSAEGEEEDELDKPLLLFQGGAPKLTQVEIHEISITACQPPFSSIVSLRLHHPPRPYDIDQYRRLLVGSSKLTDLQLFGNIIDTEELYMIATSKTALIKMPSLRSLMVSPSWSTGPFTMYSLLASLDTPALECLTLHCSPWQNHVSEFQEIFRNYGPPRYPLLRSLALRYADFSQPLAMWFTSMLPSLTSISLIECKSPARFFSLILPGDDRPSNEHHPTDGDDDVEEDGNLGSMVGDESASAKKASDSVHLPQLFRICLSPIDLASLHVLCDVISQRILLKIPIAALEFSPIAVSSIPEDKLEWLRARVRIEVCEQN
jgi:hypothetical protein